MTEQAVDQGAETAPEVIAEPWKASVGLVVDQAYLGSPYTGIDAWRAAAEAGAEWLSVVEEAYGLPEERIHQLRDDADKAGIPINLVACPAFGLADPRDAVRDFNLEWAKAQVDFARGVGARRVKVLLGEWVWKGNWSNELQWQLVVENMRRLCDYAEQHSITVSLEPEALENAYINDTYTLVQMLDDVASPVLSANVDTSHLVVRAIHPSGIRLLKGRLDTVNFSDSNGRWHEHLPPGTGVSDMAAFAAEVSGARRSDDALIAVVVGPFADPENAYEKVAASVDATRRLFGVPLDPAGGGTGL
ncbi:sugar phosphate isomerase/epimerase family protein [Streptomyces sp. NPDC093970]|uniref:sugar phosphate isomerase/epimerase family protein n=1 Tax=Streptomyces sp. NPDC093970 TaxID=3155076 RepID=UPI003446EA29